MSRNHTFFSPQPEAPPVGVVRWSQPKNHLTNKYIDWNNYRDLLQEMINLSKKIKSAEDIDTAVADFNET